MNVPGATITPRGGDRPGGPDEQVLTENGSAPGRHAAAATARLEVLRPGTTSYRCEGGPVPAHQVTTSAAFPPRPGPAPRRRRYTEGTTPKALQLSGQEHGAVAAQPAADLTDEA